jgi:uncharacterized protein (TIGR00369 family)
MQPDMLATGQQILAMQPFSVFLGASLTVFAPGHAELTLPMRPEFKQQFGYAHGGIISYLADNALTFVGGSVLGPQILTSEYKINYVLPATGETLVARASVIASTARQAVCRCDVFSMQGEREELCATAQGTIVTTSRAAG